MRNDVSLAPLTWFKTGGTAKYLSEPATLEELKNDLAFAAKNGLPFEVLGEGANTLVSDEGYTGMIIHPVNKELKLTEREDCFYLEAGAGAKVQDAIDYALERKALGLEEFSGLPGTIGGAAFINAHFFEFFLADFLVSAVVVSPSGETKEVSKDWKLP